MRRLILPAVAAALTGCAASLQTTASSGVMGPLPAATVDSWVASTRPPAHRYLPFHWAYNTDGGAGRGSMSIASPDSLHLEYRAPLGFSPGAASIIGDSTVWAEPADKVQDFVPAYPLLWAMVGIARPAATGWAVEGRDDPKAVSWRYVRGADTISYRWVRSSPAILEVYVRLDNRPIGRVRTEFGADGLPAKARLDVLTTPARLDIVFDKKPKQKSFDGDLWLAPHDQ